MRLSFVTLYLKISTFFSTCNTAFSKTKCFFKCYNSVENPTRHVNIYYNHFNKQYQQAEYEFLPLILHPTYTRMISIS